MISKESPDCGLTVGLTYDDKPLCPTGIRILILLSKAGGLTRQHLRRDARRPQLGQQRHAHLQARHGTARHSTTQHDTFESGRRRLGPASTVSWGATHPCQDATRCLWLASIPAAASRPATAVLPDCQEKNKGDNHTTVVLFSNWKENFSPSRGRTMCRRKQPSPAAARPARPPSHTPAHHTGCLAGARRPRAAAPQRRQGHRGLRQARPMRPPAPAAGAAGLSAA